MKKKTDNTQEEENVEKVDETTESEDTIEVEVVDLEEGEAAENAAEGDDPQVISVKNMSPEADQLLRLKAEYDNFRKRTAKEKIALKDDALRQTALEFLPVYDNLDRALQQPSTDETLKKGVEMTLNQLKSVLEKLEVEKISALGELFDPNLHEALTHVDDDRWGENTVTEVFMDGFTYKGKVIRFAKVKVAN